MGSMNNPADGRGMFSRLPDDPEYWDKLGARIVNDAVPTLATYREDRNEWWSVLARFSTALAVGATAAVLAAVLLFPRDEPNGTPPESGMVFGLAPSGPLAEPMLEIDGPPTLERLIALRYEGGTDE